MSAAEDLSSPMPSTKLHGLKTSSAESIASPTAWLSVASRLFAADVSRVRRRAPLARSTAPLPGVYRAALTSTRFTRSSSERLDDAAVFGFLPSRALHRVPASRHSRSGIHRESGRHSRNSFLGVCPNPMKSPNHALQRTAPGVTAPAPRRPAAQEPRRPPQSLSLGSLGHFARLL